MTKGKLPALGPLNTFEVAARHLSFTRAGEELYLTAARGPDGAHPEEDPGFRHNNVFEVVAEDRDLDHLSHGIASGEDMQVNNVTDDWGSWWWPDLGRGMSFPG